MADRGNQLSLRHAALIAGLAILLMVFMAPFAELYVYPKLMVQGNAEQTAKNIMAHESLFIATLFCYLVTYMFDIVVAWALYILLKPVNAHLSLLTAWFRIGYAIISTVALLDLMKIVRLTDPSNSFLFANSQQLYNQVMFLFKNFRYGFHFAIIFFAIHLLLLGMLVLKADYIPKIMGILLMITGLGYLSTSVQPYLFSNINIDFAVYTFYGEIIFMLWLLIRGYKIKEIN